MPYKPRTESTELLMLKSLNTRMNLSTKDKQFYFNLQKGYEGELIFDSWTEKLQCECFILNDLLLKINNTTFQIDSIMITSETTYLFEVKNFEGDFYYESDRFYKKPKTELMNPLHQLSRSESLLRQLLHNLGFNLPIDAAVVFINPQFTLYQAPLDKPMIFPTQVHRYFQKLNNIHTRLNEKHKILADKIISLHIHDSTQKQLPSYDFHQLRKGIICIECSSFSVSVKLKKYVCEECGHKESLPTAVLQSVREFRLLFPFQKMTTNIIHEWCQGVLSKRRIRRILDENYKMVGVHQWSYYE